MEYETIVIPKGTLLFRGVHNVTTLTSDFAGIPTDAGFCLHKNFNVFFYPFPFVSNTISDYKYHVMHVTMRDLKLVNLISPSKFNRQDKSSNIGGITTCDRIPKTCGVSGRNYDPCVDYSKVSGDVSGMLAIAKADAKTLKTKREPYERWINKYFITYKDSRDIIGVPELILHPRMDKTERTEKIVDFESWYHSNKSALNYNYLHVMPYEVDSIQNLMDDFLSKDGLDLGDDTNYHLKINKNTGFFQIDEFSNNQSELISPTANLIPGTEMTLKHQNIYESVIEKKFPKVDRVPPMLTAYNKRLKAIEINSYPAMDQLTLYETGFEPLIVGTVVDGDSEESGVIANKIEGKHYGFLLTPKGKEILKNAIASKDRSVTKVEKVEKHPLNNEVSAYYLTQIGPTKFKVNEPALHINGILYEYAKKQKLIGASRRRTLRLRRH